MDRREKLDRKYVDRILKAFREENIKPLCTDTEIEKIKQNEPRTFGLLLRFSFVTIVKYNLDQISDSFKDENEFIPWNALKVICDNYNIENQERSELPKIYNWLREEISKIEDQLSFVGYTEHIQYLKSNKETSKSIFTKSHGFRN